MSPLRFLAHDAVDVQKFRRSGSGDPDPQVSSMELGTRRAPGVTIHGLPGRRQRSSWPAPPP